MLATVGVGRFKTRPYGRLAVRGYGAGEELTDLLEISIPHPVRGRVRHYHKGRASVSCCEDGLSVQSTFVKLYSGDPLPPRQVPLVDAVEDHGARAV